MPGLCNLNLRRRATRLATPITVLTAWGAVTHAQPIEGATTAMPTYALYDCSTLTGSGDTITASWVPVMTTAGTSYYIIMILSNVDSSDNLTVGPGYPQIIPAPAIVVAKFKAGNYAGPSTVYPGNALITINGLFRNFDATQGEAPTATARRARVAVRNRPAHTSGV